MTTKTIPERILLKKTNDSKAAPGLLADNVIAVRRTVNLFDLSLPDTIGYPAVAWTAVIAEGGKVESLLVQTTLLPKAAEAPVVERFRFWVLGSFPDNDPQFGAVHNTLGAGGRNIGFSHNHETCFGRAILEDNRPSEIFKDFGDTLFSLEITFGAWLHVKTGYAEGSGFVAFRLIKGFDTTHLSAADIRETFLRTRFEIIGWTPHLHFTEHGRSA
jgi:hypothetical protein